jgi:hypothetical protein
MEHFQVRATPCNARIITRSWSRKAVRVRSSALHFEEWLGNSHIHGGSTTGLRSTEVDRYR